MTRLLSSGSPEPNNTGSPSTSIIGSEDDDCYSQQNDESDDDDKATSMDGCSDEEAAQGQRTKKRIKELALGEARSVKSLSTKDLAELVVEMIECMAELEDRVQSSADSLARQGLWNQEMQREFLEKIGTKGTLAKEMAALKKQVEVLSSSSAVKDREIVGSKRQRL
ncbi:uncharacterized protein N7511_000815 [Penicillium nucicola]|uniref:uncharacterized protein n=1 Tax=Penicillium nucicola TaxID=1850975 RepID=UPI00254515BD|nr:uncharacterized protein N7511_000815 [Penicillium nucicola]KAJ5775804.1 hypothetical protein N7511_000815 [Penicillium nucicola]